MGLLDVFKVFKRGSDVVRNNKQVTFYNWHEHHYPFAKVIFSNIIDILIDICNDVEYINTKGLVSSLFIDFKRFFDVYGKTVMSHLFHNGYEVIGYSRTMHTDGLCRLRILTLDEYRQFQGSDGILRVIASDPNTDVFVMKSSTYQVYNCSDYQLLLPWLIYLDNCMNASNTSASRLGNLLVMTPKSDGTGAVMLKKDREQAERYIQENYGPLANQKQVLLLGQAMETHTINLAAMDTQMANKIRIAILSICDRVKVPANQVAIIDAGTSKAFANGSEMQQGDFAKYQSFERLLYQTFGILSEAMGLDLEYTIHNKPQVPTTDGI